MAHQKAGNTAKITYMSPVTETQDVQSEKKEEEDLDLEEALTSLQSVGETPQCRISPALALALTRIPFAV